METIIEKVKKGGILTIPRKVLDSIGLTEGDEVFLRKDGRKLMVEPAIQRKRIIINPDIIDELVDHEDFFTPEEG
jgi:antitoxin component of MazEF toxin-antitoxin module